VLSLQPAASAPSEPPFPSQFAITHAVLLGCVDAGIGFTPRSTGLHGGSLIGVCVAAGFLGSIVLLYVMTKIRDCLRKKNRQLEGNQDVAQAIGASIVSKDGTRSRLSPPVP